VIIGTPADAEAVLQLPRRRRGGAVRKERWKEYGLGYLFILPAFLIFGVFTFYPFVKNFWLAAHETPLYPGNPAPYVGIHQFTTTVTSSMFLQSLESTAIFTVIAVPIGVFLGLALAVIANQRLKGIAFFRLVFSATAVTGVAVAAVIFGTLLSPTNGLLQSWGIDTAPGIAQSPGWALYAVSGIQAWQFMGLSFIIMLAGLQSLPEEVLEAARTDGASTWTVFWRVTVPLMSPTIFFAGVIGTIIALQSYGVVDILIASSGQGSQAVYTHTNLLINYIYDEIYNRQFGVAACLAIALFLITLVVTAVQFRVLAKRVHYGN
jgi:sn-glycerol 3-phosphate transport system permease protein